MKTSANELEPVIWISLCYIGVQSEYYHFSSMYLLYELYSQVLTFLMLILEVQTCPWQT